MRVRSFFTATTPVKVRKSSQSPYAYARAKFPQLQKPSIWTSQDPIAITCVGFRDGGSRLWQASIGAETLNTFSGQADLITLPVESGSLDLNSTGGGLFTTAGNLIGVTGVISADGESMEVIPMNRIRKFFVKNRMLPSGPPPEVATIPDRAAKPNPLPPARPEFSSESRLQHVEDRLNVLEGKLDRVLNLLEQSGKEKQ